MSEQVVATPWEFIRAVEARFGRFDWDLAATHENKKAPWWLGPGSSSGEDSLSDRFDWGRLIGCLWLNPPFKDIAPWAKKAKESGARVVMLALASIGTEWYRDHVEGHALMVPLAPRLTFEGHKTPYPKDLALFLYGPWVSPGLAKQWRWKP